jgi:hypothetical protein
MWLWCVSPVEIAAGNMEHIMNQFFVYLADPYGNLGKTFNHNLVASLMHNYFDRIAKANKKTGAMAVAWIYSPKAIAPYELLIYFVPSRMHSLVTSMKGAHLLPINDSDGMTVVPKHGKDGRGSEVYVGSMSMAEVAAVAFHEAMHNKLPAGFPLHDPKKGGGGLANAKVGSATPLTNANVALMAKHLFDRTNQWMGGFKMVTDPLRGM